MVEFASRIRLLVMLSFALVATSSSAHAGAHLGAVNAVPALTIARGATALAPAAGKPAIGTYTVREHMRRIFNKS